MVHIVLTALLSALISVGFFEVIKDFFPKLPSIAKTIIGVVIEALVAFALFAVSALPAWATIVIGIVTTIAFAQLGYKYLAKLIEAIKTKLNKE